jgi:hypothetical protein
VTNRVEQRRLRPPLPPVAGRTWTLVAGAGQRRARGLGERCRISIEYVGTQLREHRRLVAGAGADLEHACAGA